MTGANIHEWIRYEGYEHFAEAMRRGRGVLFATAHLGNWELSAFAHALLSRPMYVIARPLDNRRIDELPPGPGVDDWIGADFAAAFESGAEPAAGAWVDS